MLPLRQSPVSSRTWPALAALLLWALVAASVALWWLHLPSSKARGTEAAVVNPGTAAAPASGHAAVVRALGHVGSAAATPDAHKRFVLMGVIAGRSGQGSALLAVDGQHPAVFVQGQVVADSWRLQQVSEAGVRLQGIPDGPALDLQLAARP